MLGSIGEDGVHVYSPGIGLHERVERSGRLDAHRPTAGLTGPEVGPVARFQEDPDGQMQCFRSAHGYDEVLFRIGDATACVQVRHGGTGFRQTAHGGIQLRRTTLSFNMVHAMSRSSAGGSKLASPMD